MNYDNNEIRDYLKNKLSPAQRTKFEKRLEEEDAFADEVRFQQLILKGIQSKAFMTTVEKVQDEYDTKKGTPIAPLESRTSPKTTQRRIVRWVASIAAVVVLGIMFFLWNPTSSVKGDPIALAGKYATPIDTVEIIRNGSPKENWKPTLLDGKIEVPCSPIEETVLLNFTSSDEIKKQFPSLKGTLNPRRTLVLGYYHAEKGVPEKAHLYFDLLLNGNFTDFEQQAAWQKALLLLKQNKVEDARVYLNKLVNWSGKSDFKRLAVALLKELG